MKRGFLKMLRAHFFFFIIFFLLLLLLSSLLLKNNIVVVAAVLFKQTIPTKSNVVVKVKRMKIEANIIGRTTYM